MALNTNKDLKQFYSIGEVAKMFDVNETLLRFWEKEFKDQIKPKKATGRNIRQYTKADIEQIRIIYDLVKVRGLKLAAARDLLKKNKEGTEQKLDVIARLREIKEELLVIKGHLSAME